MEILGVLIFLVIVGFVMTVVRQVKQLIFGFIGLLLIIGCVAAVL